MKRLVPLALATLLSAGVLAQDGPAVQRSSNPRGVQIQGETRVNASAQNVQAVSAGDANSAKNAAGAIKGGVQIQGNTRINTSAQNVNSVAVGKKNTAGNDVGSIGGQ